MIMRRIPNRITVDCQELEGSPTEEASAEFWQGTRATRIFQCASVDRIKLINEFLGYWSVPNTYHEPHSYIDLSFLCVATSAATKPFGKMGQARIDPRFADYPKTIVIFSYSIPPETFEAFGGLVTVTESMQDASEFLTCSKKGLYWYVDGVTNELISDFDAPGKINNLMEWTYEIRRAQVVPAGVWGYPGSVNNATCHSDTYGRYFPVETLLCGSPEITVERTYNKTFYNIRLRFLVKNNGTLSAPKGWNHFPRRSITDDVDVSYERMVRAVDAPNTASGWKLFYPLADFSTIFVP